MSTNKDPDKKRNWKVTLYDDCGHVCGTYDLTDKTHDEAQAEGRKLSNAESRCESFGVVEK